jgi:hypothetical protein
MPAGAARPAPGPRTVRRCRAVGRARRRPASRRATGRGCGVARKHVPRHSASGTAPTPGPCWSAAGERRRGGPAGCPATRRGGGRAGRAPRTGRDARPIAKGRLGCLVEFGYKGQGVERRRRSGGGRSHHQTRQPDRRTPTRSGKSAGSSTALDADVDVDVDVDDEHPGSRRWIVERRQHHRENAATRRSR